MRGLTLALAARRVKAKFAVAGNTRFYILRAKMQALSHIAKTNKKSMKNGHAVVDACVN